MKNALSAEQETKRGRRRSSSNGGVMNKLGYGILAAMIIIFGLIAIGTSGQAPDRICSAEVHITDSYGRTIQVIGGCENDAREAAQK